MAKDDLAGRLSRRVPHLQRSEATELLRTIDQSDQLQIVRYKGRREVQGISTVVLHLVAFVTDLHISTAKTVIETIQEDGHHVIEVVQGDDHEVHNRNPEAQNKKRMKAISELNSQSTSVRTVPGGGFESKRSRH